MGKGGLNGRVAWSVFSDMNATIITTVRHNIGDDFVREGILHLLQPLIDLERVELVHKHSPVTAIYGCEHLRNLRLSRLAEPLLRIVRARNRIDDADLLVQSGAPVYWCHQGGPHCADNEWYEPLVRKRFLPYRRGRKFLNLAGGSCQRYHSDGGELDTCTRCRNYIREFFDVCDLTILRDKLAQIMLRQAGRTAEVLPCTSIFARDYLNIKPLPGEYIVLNFMENGGHYTFGQAIDADAWRNQFSNLAKLAGRMGKVVIACHTREEQRIASSVVPDLQTFLVPDDHVEFMKFYARASFGVVNRVHAAFMMASLGKPAAVIGNDSRALMIENLGLQSYYVGDVSKVGVESIIENVAGRTASYVEEIEVLRRSSRDRYTTLISSALSQ